MKLNLSLSYKHRCTKLTPEHIPLIPVSPLHPPGTHSAGFTRHGGNRRTVRHSTSLRATQLHTQRGRQGGPYPHSSPCHTQLQHTHMDIKTLWHRAEHETVIAFWSLWSICCLNASQIDFDPPFGQMNMKPGTPATILSKQFWTWGCWPMRSKEGLMGLSQSADCPPLP